MDTKRQIRKPLPKEKETLQHSFLQHIIIKLQHFLSPHFTDAALLCVASSFCGHTFRRNDERVISFQHGQGEHDIDMMNYNQNLHTR